MIIVGVVGADNTAAVMWRAGSGTFQPSNDGEIGSDTYEVLAHEMLDHKVSAHEVPDHEVPVVRSPYTGLGLG